VVTKASNLHDITVFFVESGVKHRNPNLKQVWL